MGARGRTRQLIIILLCTLAASASAQHYAVDSRAYFDFGEQCYVTAKQSADADSIRIYVNTANALFSFVRSDRSIANKGAYYAVRDISIELRETPAGKILATKNRRDTIFTSNFEQTTSKYSWNSAVIAVGVSGLKTQAIEVHTEIRDGFLSKLAERPRDEVISFRTMNTVRSVTGKDSSFIGIGDPIIFDAVTTGCEYCTKNWGNTTEFSRDLYGAIPLAMPQSESIDSIVLTLVQTQEYPAQRKYSPRTVQRKTVASNDLLRNHRLGIASIDSTIGFELTDKMDSVLMYQIALFRLAGDSLEQGDYELTVAVYSGTDHRTIVQKITPDWHDMPLSLENPRDALPPLQYLTTDDEYSALTGGSREEQQKKLKDFWKKQDPTPSTAYNERMAEFYKRADYAYFNFARSPRQLDGAMTDRGKIYILFGPPSNIQRSFLLGEQPMEIWTYTNNVRKVFKFMDQRSNGEFKLVDVKAL